MTNLLLVLILLALPGGAAILGALIGMATFAFVAAIIIILIVVAAVALIADPNLLVFVCGSAVIAIVLTLAAAGAGRIKSRIETKFGAKAWELTIQRIGDAVGVALAIAVMIAAYVEKGLRGALIVGTALVGLGTLAVGAALLNKMGRTYPTQTRKIANRALIALSVTIVVMVVVFPYVSNRTDWLPATIIISVFLCVIAFGFAFATRSVALKNASHESA